MNSWQFKNINVIWIREILKYINLLSKESGRHELSSSASSVTGLY